MVEFISWKSWKLIQKTDYCEIYHSHLYIMCYVLGKVRKNLWNLVNPNFKRAEWVRTKHYIKYALKAKWWLKLWISAFCCTIAILLSSKWPDFRVISSDSYGAWEERQLSIQREVHARKVRTFSSSVRGPISGGVSGDKCDGDDRCSCYLQRWTQSYPHHFHGESRLHQASHNCGRHLLWQK